MMHLNARLLIIGMIGLIGGSVAYGAEERLPEEAEKGYAGSGMHTPVKAADVSEATVDPTPGQKIAERQREVFVKERFEAVFGAEAIEELTHSKGISWDILTDADIPFDDARKRSMIRNIKQFFLSYTGERTISYLLLADDVMRIEGKIAEVPEDRLVKHSKEYFERMFPGASIEFLPKMGGDQLGSIVIVKPVEGPAVKYYVKTHAGGLKAEKSTGAKPVDAIELMAYKVLEGFGVGCETHFFGRDERNFYIATRDANEYGGFEEYSRVERKNKISTQPIWGILSEVLSPHARENAVNHATIEAALATDLLAQNFIQRMSLLDVLARVMLLTDLQTNGGNFGFVKRDGKLPLLKVIDFRLGDVSRMEEYKFTESRFRGFLVGNGLFNYYTADEAVCYALRNRPKELRAAEALRVFESMLSGWEEKIEVAKRSAMEGVATAELPEEVAERLLGDISTYAEILKENFRLFEEMLRGYRGD